jgi:hypothetical protein
MQKKRQEINECSERNKSRDGGIKAKVYYRNKNCSGLTRKFPDWYWRFVSGTKTTESMHWTSFASYCL